MRSIKEMDKRLDEREQEIEKLKDLCDKYEEEHKTTFEEWKKAINIINELEGYLDLKRKSYIEGFKWSGLEIIDQTKDFLQELKGSDKE